MSKLELLSVLEVREFVSDYAPNNHLLDGEEFSDTFIALCRELAVDAWNEVPPVSHNTLSNFPSKGMLLYGTLWKMFEGKAALLARNTMSYSDGGISLAIEERSELYQGLANRFQAQFTEGAQKLKIHLNMESGWNDLGSDQATFPLW